EQSAVVADRLGILARHLKDGALDAFAAKLVVVIASALVAQGRAPDAIAALDALLKKKKPQRAGRIVGVVFGLGLRTRLLRTRGDVAAADADVAVLRGLSPGILHAEPEWTPKELASMLAETQKRPLDDALSDLALRLGETCWILETNEISYVKGSTL